MLGMIVLVVMFTIAGCCCYIIGENRAMYKMYKYTIEIMDSFEVEDVPIDFAKGVLYAVEELYDRFDIDKEGED